MSKKRGKSARRAETAVKYEAIDLLEEMGAPASVLKLFDTMLGGIEAQWRAGEADRRWVAPAIDYEARALHGGRDDVPDSEIVDKVFVPLKPEGFSRRVALREVGAARKGDWYRAFVLSRRYALEKK